MLFKELHQEYNIHYDTDTRQLISGGKPGHRLNLTQRPSALQFWRKYQGYKDSIDRLQHTGQKGNGGMNRRLRGVKESLLRVDDSVAVIGTLSNSGSGLKIEAGR